MNDVAPCSNGRAVGPSLSREASQLHHHYIAAAIILCEHPPPFAAYSILTNDSLSYQIISLNVHQSASFTGDPQTSASPYDSSKHSATGTRPSASYPTLCMFCRVNPPSQSSTCKAPRFPPLELHRLPHIASVKMYVPNFTLSGHGANGGIRR